MPGKPNQERRDQIRRTILEHAWALCRERGLAELSLRDLAARVGMTAPSLYSYFGSKDAIYDAMFAQGQIQLGEATSSLAATGRPREDLRVATRAFFAFCVTDPVRYQLLFQRTIPGFEPSPESYKHAVDRMTEFIEELAAVGITEPRHVDLWTGIVSGLTAQQLANEPGGDRWTRLLDETVDMFCDHVGVAPDTTIPGGTR